MSFLTVPSRIRDAMAVVREAIAERYVAAGGYESSIAHFSPPYEFRTSSFQSEFKLFRMYIRQLYSLAFPPENFGRWSELRPNFYDGQYVGSATPLLDTAIAEDLQRAGIDPSGFFWEVPHRFCDGNFIRACYYLLNERILYFLPESIAVKCKTLEKYYKDGSTVIHGDNDGIPMICVANGFRKDTMRYHFDAQFYNYDTRFNFSGEWSIKSTSILTSRLEDPVDENDESQYIMDKTVGERVTSCFDNESEIIEPMPETMKNISYYRNWGDLKYRYVYRAERQRVDGIMITADNLPPLNYKYFD